MFVVDTSVLLYAANTDAVEHERCRDLLESRRAQPTARYTTWGILYEFLRVSTHPRVFDRPWNALEAWRFVAALIASPGLRILTETERHEEAAAEVLPQVPGLAGNLFFDARDADFHRFPFVEVLDPLARPPRARFP